jgi:hypothetical protein
VCTTCAPGDQEKACESQCEQTLRSGGKARELGRRARQETRQGAGATGAGTSERCCRRRKASPLLSSSAGPTSKRSKQTSSVRSPQTPSIVLSAGFAGSSIQCGKSASNWSGRESLALCELRIADLAHYNTSLFRTDCSIFVVTNWVSSSSQGPSRRSRRPDWLGRTPCGIPPTRH